MLLKGKVHVFGRDIDTDAIVPARYLNTFDPDELGKHCFEDIDDNFLKKVEESDFIAAGENFGCGSSREHAPLAIKGAGVSAVLAESFARIFLRNAINVGLYVYEVPGITSFVSQDDQVELDTESGIIKNLSTSRIIKAKPLPHFLQHIISSGGLVEYAKKRDKD